MENNRKRKNHFDCAARNQRKHFFEIKQKLKELNEYLAFKG